MEEVYDELLIEEVVWPARGGHWFGLVDPWPEYWSNDWYDRDDVYVDYYTYGYYLYNRRYPGDRISISFYVN